MKISLKAARINSNLTQSQVADILKISKYTILNWETGRTKIKYYQLKLLSELYKIELTDFSL